MKGENGINNVEKQKWEEFRAANIIAQFIHIPFSQFALQDFPDLKVRIKEKTIGIEITSIRIPITSNIMGNMDVSKGCNIGALEQAIKEITYEYMSCFQLFDISVDYQLNTNINILNLKKDKAAIREEIQAIFLKFKKKLDKDFRKEYIQKNFVIDGGKYILMTRIEFFPKAHWKELFIKDRTLINISFSYKGFLFPLKFDNIKHLIDNKNLKLDSYKKRNEQIDEFWLCLFLPREELGLSIKGMTLPPYYHSDYNKIIVAQEFPPHAHYLK